MSDTRTIIPFVPFTSASNTLKRKSEGGTANSNWETILYTDMILKKSPETEAITYGVERRLYELNPNLACLSPTLIHASVVTPAEALIALENVATQPNRPSFPIDRHLTAFLISRWKGLSFMDLRGMGNPQREIKNLAALKVLASIQEHFKTKELPNLCRWMAQICAPMVGHRHNLNTGAPIQKRIAKAVSSGQLLQLVWAFENQQPLTEGKNDYQEAKIEALLIQSEIKEIESKAEEWNRFASISKATVSGCLAHFWRRMRFAAIAKKNNKRAAQLHHRLEELLEIWGDALVP